jgi:hypothetical protein
MRSVGYLYAPQDVSPCPAWGQRPTAPSHGALKGKVRTSLSTLASCTMWGPHAVKRANASCWARFHSCSTTWGRTPSRVPTRPERESDTVRPTSDIRRNPGHHMTHHRRHPGARSDSRPQRTAERARPGSCQVSSRNLSAQSGDDSVSVPWSVLNSVLFGHWSRARGAPLKTLS